MQANRILIPHGSADWLAFRQGKISASKVPIILGISPYASPLQLYEEEMGLREPQAQQAHMTRGLEIEDTVRQWFFDQYRIEVFPCVLQSKENPLFIASLDGMNSINTCMVEIKNNNKDYHEIARSGTLCGHHLAQVNFQMYVSGLDECYYISHRQGDYAIVVVKRDQAYIDEMIPKLLDFKRRLTDFDPPPPSDKDYEDMSNDSDLYGIVVRYKRATEAVKQAEKDAEYFKRMIQERVGQKNVKGNGWRFTRYKVQGRVDYDKAFSHHKLDIDLSQFRKPDSVAYRLTID